MHSLKILLFSSSFLFLGCFGTRQETDKQPVNKDCSRFIKSNGGVGRNIKERMPAVYSLCRKKIPMPQALIDKMKSFLLDDKLSIVNRGPGCRGSSSLDMFIFDGEKYHYFDMPRPTYIDDNMKKDPRIPEYIEFYNEMAAFIKQDFSECRWDNFGNKDKMIRECGQFNWRWKEQYPDLVE